MGLISLQGFDGFFISVGGFIAYVTILLLIAEPLRNAAKYNMGDVLAYRLRPRPVRALTAFSTLTIATFYMIVQMISAGAFAQKPVSNFPDCAQRQPPRNLLTPNLYHWPIRWFSISVTKVEWVVFLSDVRVSNV